MNQLQLMRLTSIGLVSILLLGILRQLQISGNEPFLWLVQKQQGDSEQTFANWCYEKASLSPETKHTVEVLLKKAGTTECEAADRQLSSLTKLKLDKNQIRDIKPLASLTHLDWLSLDNNQISDIKPLASLTKLNYLALTHNQIKDIKPLASLTKLNYLALTHNQIKDIKP
ncbi:leucine-rich repeat domain-containing protein, partial [Microcoleus sp. S28C3]|uniref:leucine-rich repeat domain-containing protein n=1 Tax=Microcoleus sp. S28C3 TaxID=3055414 RepID=UPI002FD74CBE